MLLGSAAGAGTDDAVPPRLLDIPLDHIVRNDAQPRTHFDQNAIASLATSIEANGVIQPIAVRPLPGERWEIIAGERRWLAARRAGLRTVPAVVHDVDERETLVLALVENLVREDLNPLETARAYAALQDEFSMSTADLARAVGRSRPAVANSMRLLELPDDILASIEAGRLTEGHGRALLGTDDRVQQRRIARLIVERGLTVRAVEALVRDITDNVDAPATRHTAWNRQASPELERSVERFAEHANVRTRLKVGDRGAKLELRVDSERDLAELVDRLSAALTLA